MNKHQRYIVEALEKLEDLIKNVDPLMSHLNTRISELKKYASEPLRVMIAGEFKAGKSTFINAMLGQKLLISDVIPTTSIVTKLTYGNSYKVIGHLKNGNSRTFNPNQLQLLTTESNEGQELRNKLSFIEVQYPNELLQYISLIDTPGLNADHQHHTDATRLALPHADIVLWLFDVYNIGTTTQMIELEKLKKDAIPTIGIVNGIDLYEGEDEELEEHIAYSSRKLKSVLQELIPISAKLSLQGKLEKDSKKLTYGNWETIEKIITKLIEDDSLKLNRILLRLNNLLEETDQLLLKEKTNLKLNEIESQFNGFLEQFHNLIDEKAQTEIQLQILKEKISYVKKSFSYPFKSIEFLRSKLWKLSPTLNTLWVKKCEIKILNYGELREQFESDLQQFYNNGNELKREWSEINSHIIIFSQERLERFKDHYNRYLDDYERLTEYAEEIDQLQEEIVESFNQFKADVNHALHNILANEIDYATGLAKKWNEHCDQLKQLFAVELDNHKFKRIRSYYTFLHSFITEIKPCIERFLNSMLNSKDINETKYLVDKINVLYDQGIGFDFIRKYETLLNWPKIMAPKLPEIDISADFITLIENQVDCLPEPLKFDISAVQTRINRTRFIAICIIIVLIYMSCN
ncbi:dynamin family protein [Tuberibacillus calidus]|uniref:dynamin family protein n=1 Tax=Tuberibacillus calidus TaxID=340097 RepID=UPI00042013CF|nr:dynamin family protein [Tuberibacillus calidus]